MRQTTLATTPRRQSSAKCSLESKTCSAVVVNAEISTYKRNEKRQSAKALPNVFPEAHGSDNRLSNSDDDEHKDHSGTGAARLSAKENWRKMCFQTKAGHILIYSV